MKYTYMIVGGCAAGLVVADLQGYVSFSDFDMSGSILQARSQSHMLLPRQAYRLRRRTNSAKASGGNVPSRPDQRITPPKPAKARPAPAPQLNGSRPPKINGVAYPGMPNGGSGGNNGNGGKDRPVRASITAKGPAVMHVTHSNDFRDMTVKKDRTGTLSIHHDYQVSAGGVKTAYPLPDKKNAPPSEHPLRAETEGPAVTGRVEVPLGGTGYIKKTTPKGVEEFTIPEGTGERKTSISDDSTHHKIETSVTEGGAVKVHGAKDKNGLPYTPEE